MEQNSSLKRGLILHLPLTEWNSSREAISGQIGTPVDVYNVLDKSGSGRRWLEFSDPDFFALWDSAPSFETADYSMIVKFMVYSFDRTQSILGYSGASIEMHIKSDGYLYMLGEGAAEKKCNFPLEINTEYVVTYTKTGSVGRFYVNGVYINYVLDSNSGTTGAYYIGSGSNGAIYGSIYMLRIFNYALSDIKVFNYSKPEYPVELSDKGVGSNKNILNLNSEGLGASTWVDKINNLTISITGGVLIKPMESNLGATFFNGSSSVIFFTGINGLTGDVTVSCLINIASYGGSSAGRIVSNGKFELFPYAGVLRCYRDGDTVSVSSALSISINTWYNIIVTSTASGITNFYINGVASGSKNQSAGTPVDSSALRVGSRTDGSRLFDGIISDLRMYNRILINDEIKQLAGI